LRAAGKPASRLPPGGGRREAGSMEDPRRKKEDRREKLRQISRLPSSFFLLESA
jgi:hypothetical protein